LAIYFEIIMCVKTRTFTVESRHVTKTVSHASFLFLIRL